MRGAPAQLLLASLALTPACAASVPAAPPAHVAASLPAPPAPSGTTAPSPPQAVAPPVVPPPSVSPASTPPAPPPAPDPAPPRHHAGPRDPAEEAAMRLGAAWTACDMGAAIGLSLSYEEVVAITSKPVDRAEWNHDARDFADQRCREFAQSKGHILTATIIKTEHHGPAESSELKVDLDIVFVQFVIEQNGEANLRGALLPFVRTPAGFKFVSKP